MVIVGRSFWSVSIIYIGLALGALLFPPFDKKVFKKLFLAAFLAFLFTVYFSLALQSVGRALEVILPISLPSSSR